MNTNIAGPQNIKTLNLIPVLWHQHNFARQDHFCSQPGNATGQITRGFSSRTGRAARSTAARWAASCLLSLGLLGTSAHADAAEPLNTWQNRTPITNTNYLQSVAYGNDRFVAVGYNGTIVVSTNNGTNWNLTPAFTTKDFNGITFANGLFVAVGSQRAIYTSTNGVNWSNYSGATTPAHYCVTYGNGRFQIAGYTWMVSSLSGSAWSLYSSPVTDDVSGLAFGNGKYVGVGYNSDTYIGSIHTSTNGTGWTAHNPQTTQSLAGVGFGNGLFVAVGDAGAITTSADGNTWTLRTSGNGNTLWGVAHGSDTFVAVGWDGTILTSTNGIAWTPRSTPTANALYGVGHGNGTFIAVGRYGTILQSGQFSVGNPTCILSQPVRNMNNFTFQFSGTVGLTYQVQASTNLINWATLTNIVCTNANTSCSLGGQTMPKRFYRVLKP